MKEFAVYSLMRLALFVSSMVVVIGVWSLAADSVHILGAIVVALVLSGIASYFLLNRPREALARRLEERARAASEAFERKKAHEDVD